MSAKAGRPGPSRPSRAITPPARSFCLVGHRSAGKTQLSEALLAAGGVVREAGRVDEGTALLDHDPESSARKSSMYPSFAWIPWRDRVLHLVDTPGASSLAWPARLARGGADLDVVVLSAVDGVERGAEDALDEARRAGRPAVAVWTRVDRLGAASDLEAGFAALREATARMGRTAVRVQLPWFECGRLVGVVDLVSRCALRGEQVEGQIPDGMGAIVEAAREELLEAIATTDEALLERYLERLDLGPEEAWSGLARAVQARTLVPVAVASGLTGAGAGPLLDLVWETAPCPVAPPECESAVYVAQWVATVPDDEGTAVAVLRVWSGDLGAQPALRHVGTGQVARVRKVYRVRGPRRAVAPGAEAGHLVAVWEPLPGHPGDVFTDGPEVHLPGPATRPPMAWAWLGVEGPAATRRTEHDRLLAALERLRRVDPGLGWADEGDGITLWGVSAAEVQLAVERLRADVGPGLRAGVPPIRYREHLVGSAERVHGLHRRADGDDVLEYGECWLDVRPTAPERGFEFEVSVDEDTLPRRFAAAVGEGARRALAAGPALGCPVVGVHVTCVDGEYDALESTEAHFELAGEAAMREALRRCHAEVLEPWSEVAVHASGAWVGALMTELPALRARLAGLEVDDDESVVYATMPDAEVLRLGARLEALAGGRAWFSAVPSHFERLPSDRVPGIARSGRRTTG